MSDEASWGLHEGDELTSELTSMRLLGGGFNYEAYLAFDEFTYSPCVVKVVRPDQVSDEGTLRGLKREVGTLESVNHPGVVRILRSQLGGDRPHVVLEHVEGPRLSTLIRKHGPLQPQQYVPLVTDLAAALHYFGNIGLVHLDIKPTNIIMGSPARLIDLSVARSQSRALALTQRVGTDAYMSPEQIVPQGPHQPGFACDVWGLGVVFYEAVSGRRAFPPVRQAGEDLERRYPQLTQPAPPLPRHVPRPVADVIHAALQVDPAQRPRPKDVSEAMEPLLEGLPRPKLTFKVRV